MFERSALVPALASAARSVRIRGLRRSLTGIENAMGLRLMASVAALLLLSSAAQAGVAEDLTAAINKCAAISDDATRHACYDRLPQLLKALPPDTPKAQEEKESSGGGFSLFGSTPIPANHIDATVEAVTYDFGLFVVTLDNGQVWRQVSAQGGRVLFSSEKKDKVKIWRGDFGDVLRIDGHPETYRVRRIK